MNTSPIYIPIFGEAFYINPPASFSIFGLTIFYYAVFVMFGFILAGVYVYLRRDDFGLTADNVLDMLLRAVIVGIIGARIYYIIFNPDNYFGAENWLNIFRVRAGGLAIYGGIIGAATSIAIYAYRKKIPIGNVLDAAVFGLFIGQIVGRFGNFINREAYGIETDLPWRMGLMTPQGFQYVHPIFLYEALWNTIGLILLHIFSKKRKSGYPGQLCLMYFMWYGFGRFFIEGIRGPDTLMLHGTNIPVSQLLAAVSCIGAVGILVYFCCFKNRNPKPNDDELILPHSGSDCEDDSENTDSPAKTNPIDEKKLRAINIARGRRAANEKKLENLDNAVKNRKTCEKKRTARSINN